MCRKHVEPGHRFHFDVGDHDLRRDAVELFDRFRRGIKRKNLVSFFATKRHDDLDHRRFVVDNYDLGHKISARRIFQF